jgi:RimJ/RimL family protein N-acetyltransferase
MAFVWMGGGESCKSDEYHERSRHPRSLMGIAETIEAKKNIGHFTYPKMLRLYLTLQMMRRGHVLPIVAAIGRRLHCSEAWYVIRKDVTRPFEIPESRIPFTIREMQSDDVDPLLSIRTHGLIGEDAYERVRRMLMLKAGIRTCYVGITDDGKPCHLHWLIGESENEKLQEFYGIGFPLLEKGEMLLEHGYTPVEYRGKGIMATAMARLARIASDKGAAHVYGFIRESNTPSLKAARKAGYSLFLERTEKWSLGRLKMKYSTLPDPTRYPFE